MAAAVIDKSEIAMLALGFTPTDEIIKAREKLGIKTQDEFIQWARGTLETAAVDALKAGDMGAFERRVTQLRRYYFENPNNQQAPLPEHGHHHGPLPFVLTECRSDWRIPH
ncbi:26S proteasome non-ATPase regulatory subunit 8 [Perkinsus olseni]|uniref:26S proteasome non-ATPase regulatory subunit 8 n=1 Tax=Perkinsus olseni TaxID=32597 RepID=A0A7J6P606_PEROL|nr:26S proteasome non-ATPase regulatory subunit 8 [Perkinsus olseni]